MTDPREIRTPRRSPARIQAIRDKIERLAKANGGDGAGVVTVYGYRPSNTIREIDDSKGIAAVKAEIAARKAS